MPTIFTKIIRGEIPCFKLAENDRFFSFLDIRPINPGHALVIPKQEVDYLFDLDPETLGALMQFAQPIAKAIENAVSCKRIGLLVAGLEVPHAHVHLVPITGEGDLTFARAKAADMTQLAELHAKITALLNP